MGIRLLCVELVAKRTVKGGYFLSYKANAFSGIDGDCNADKRRPDASLRFFYAFNTLEHQKRSIK